MQRNEYILKVSGSAPMEQALDIGNRYAVGIELAVTDERKVDNEDGTYDMEYTGRLVRAEIHTKTGKVLTKDKSRQSVKTRYAILAIKNDFKPDMDDTAFYNLIQGGIRHHLPEIINLILKDAV